MSFLQIIIGDLLDLPEHWCCSRRRAGLEILAMISAPLFIHDFWVYWPHRIEHKVPILWEFHKSHHSDERMNTSTWARDHFFQESWCAFFSVFTLGLIIDLHLAEAGKAALYPTMS